MWFVYLKYFNEHGNCHIKTIPQTSKYNLSRYLSSIFPYIGLSPGKLSLAKTCHLITLIWILFISSKRQTQNTYIGFVQMIYE